MIREYVQNKYSELLGIPKDSPLCVNLEKSTHNWAVKRSTALGDVAAADNPYHMNRYKHKFLQIQYNINNAPCLKNRILNGDVKASSIVDLSPQGLWPDGPWAAMKEVCVTKDMKKEYNSNVLKIRITRVFSDVEGVSRIRRHTMRCRQDPQMNR